MLFFFANKSANLSTAQFTRTKHLFRVGGKKGECSEIPVLTTEVHVGLFKLDNMFSFVF